MNDGDSMIYALAFPLPDCNHKLTVDWKDLCDNVIFRPARILLAECETVLDSVRIVSLILVSL